jgi:diketogulonate reductase-like aldo/keto reductase
VLVNRPFGGGNLIRRLAHRDLPLIAHDLGCTSWAQLLLKFVIGHPAITSVIPATANPQHMAGNVHAGSGLLPDQAMREQIVALTGGS